MEYIRSFLLYTVSSDRFFRFAGKAWFSPRDSGGLYDHKNIITQSRKSEKQAFPEYWGGPIQFICPDYFYGAKLIRSTRSHCVLRLAE
jgi:hypothetical protein